jgi:hypothetical protein
MVINGYIVYNHGDFNLLSWDRAGPLGPNQPTAGAQLSHPLMAQDSWG